MIVHLVRCAPKHQGSKKVRSPFNITHIFTLTEMKIHVGQCPNRAGVEEKVEKKAPHEKMVEIQCDENWDEEPEVPTYNPKEYCDKNPTNFIIHNPQGNPPAARREFRELERKRFQRYTQF